MGTKEDEIPIEQQQIVDRIKSLLDYQKNSVVAQESAGDTAAATPLPIQKLAEPPAHYIRHEKCQYVCPISGEEIPRQYMIRMSSNGRFYYYHVQYLLEALEHDRLLRDPITRIPYPYAELERVRTVATASGLNVCSDTVLHAEHEFKKLFDHVLTVSNYQNLSCYQDIQRTLNDLIAFIRGRTAESQAYPESDRIEIARMQADAAERNWRRQITQLLEPSLNANAQRFDEEIIDPLRMLLNPFLPPRSSRTRYSFDL